MATQNVPAALQALRDQAAIEAAAVDHHYPKYVTPDRQAWLDAKTPEARLAAKVLVENEAEHRAAAPQDFAKPAKADKVDKAPA